MIQSKLLEPNSGIYPYILNIYGNGAKNIATREEYIAPFLLPILFDRYVDKTTAPKMPGITPTTPAIPI